MYSKSHLLAASGRQQAPGGQDVDRLPGRQARRGPSGIGQPHVVEQLAAVTLGQDREVVDARQPATGRSGSGADQCARWNARAAAPRAWTALVSAEHGGDDRGQQASASPAASATVTAWAVRAGAERPTARSQSRTVAVGAPAATAARRHGGTGVASSLSSGEQRRSDGVGAVGTAGKAPGGQQHVGDTAGAAASPVRAQPTALTIGQLHAPGPRWRPDPERARAALLRTCPVPGRRRTSGRSSSVMTRTTNALRSQPQTIIGTPMTPSYSSNVAVNTSRNPRMPCCVRKMWRHGVQSGLDLLRDVEDRPVVGLDLRERVLGHFREDVPCSVDPRSELASDRVLEGADASRLDFALLAAPTALGVHGLLVVRRSVRIALLLPLVPKHCASCEAH